MYKICVALVAVLAVAAAKPGLGYSYATPYSSAYSVPAAYDVAPVAPAYPAYAAPSVYPASYPVVAKSYAAPVAAYAAPVESYAAPVATYAAPFQAYSAAYPAYGYSGYPGYTGYSGYSGFAPLSYGSTYGELPLYKKK